MWRMAAIPDTPFSTVVPVGEAEEINITALEIHST
jgi:hypothetical protein